MKISLKRMPILIMTVLILILAFASYSFAADNGLVAQYKLNGDCKDASGNGNDGSVVGDVSFVDDPVVGKCAVFNNGYINVPSSPGLNLGNNFTISVWVLVDPAMAANGNKEGSIISKLDDPSNYNNYHAYTRGTFGVRMDARTTNGEVNIQTGPFQDWGLSSSWSHLIFSYDGQTLYLYNDGVLKATQEIKGGASIKSSGNKMRIGTGNDINNSNLFYKGKMADLRIYGNALSSDQIKALYNGGADTGTMSQQPAASGTATSGGSATNGSTNPATDTENQLPFDDGSNSNNSNNQGTQNTPADNASSITIKQEVNVLVNGHLLQSDTPSFINGDDRTMVTLSAIAEALGAKVEWDPNTKTITITLDDKVVKLVIGQGSYTVNGEGHNSDTAPGIVNGRTVVPAGVVGAALGAKVGWNPQTSTVTVDSGSPGSQQGTSSTSSQTTQQTTQPGDWQDKFPIYSTQGDNFNQPSTTVRTNAKLSYSGLFEANTTVNLNEENYGIKVKVNITFVDAKGNTLFNGNQEYDLKKTMPLDQWTLQVPADIMPKVTNVSIQQIKLGSQQLDQNPTGATLVTSQTLTAHDKNDNINLIGTFHMESNATLNFASGRLDVHTKTWDTDPYFGFTGAVQVGIRDSGGNLLWTSSVHTFGVDSPSVATLTGSKSTRVDDWSETAPGNVLSSAVTLEIKQAKDKGGSLFN